MISELYYFGPFNIFSQDPPLSMGMRLYPLPSGDEDETKF